MLFLLKQCSRNVSYYFFHTKLHKLNYKVIMFFNCIIQQKSIQQTTKIKSKKLSLIEKIEKF